MRGHRRVVGVGAFLKLLAVGEGNVDETGSSQMTFVDTLTLR